MSQSLGGPGTEGNASLEDSSVHEHDTQTSDESCTASSAGSPDASTYSVSGAGGSGSNITLVNSNGSCSSGRPTQRQSCLPPGIFVSTSSTSPASSQSLIPAHQLDRRSKLLSDYHCPICRSLMKESFISRCGHSFCYLCISQHLTEKQDCPLCRSSLTRDQIFPNFLLTSLLERSTGYVDSEEDTELRTKLRHDLLDQREFTREEIDDMLSTLRAKKRKLEATDEQVELEVLLDFLRNTRAEKEEALARLNAQIQCLDNDLRRAHEKLEVLKQYNGYTTTQGLEEDEEDQLNSGGAQVPNQVSEEEDEAVPARVGSKRTLSQMERENKSEVGPEDEATESELQNLKIAQQVNINKKRVADHFEDLQRCYFDFSLSSSARRESALSSFCSTISKFTKYSRFEHVNTLRYGDIFNTSSIVSSIEFDRDDEYFATAGVTKKIKIFEYGSIEKTGLVGTSLKGDDRTEGLEVGEKPRHQSNKKPILSVLHYPVREMTCRSKISCLSWNSYIKSQIASSDYEGIVSLWDSQTGLNTLNYDEHEKRAWSVDFSRTDPTRLASGSDDTKVKIWSTTHKASVCTIESKANICCVKFNPESSHHIAFGSADHHIHYYDLRKATEPLFVFKGHRKAVSYVKFLGREELVSASTDSTLKLWNTSRMNCARTYTGHVNEKNFVGLSASGDWISCGSENNAVYTYYKELRDPVVTVKFGNSNPVTGEENADEDPTQFVSSVCWKKNTSNNILLAANSSGVIKVLELV
ncbi:E3 ubiquitin-protein ligase RFWD2 [Entomortierella parvispora]|uniref:E3 ubiquitin-protein ligase RFWD2 n=1 Tax=Entomortierella parvispora TaxID=205924 RepID=A0A9P3H9M6_9FUNG|nr:E3 ubiquitin-protein ligase RFWD2 [Entomortierella parvispora]